jgi:predicted GIY-YIG superfamily endonuclease
VGASGGARLQVLRALWPDAPRHAEQVPTIYEAIVREKAIKKWNRAWKIELIEQANPDWDDLFESINA